MRTDLHSLRLCGGIALHHGRLQRRTVAIENGRISGGPFEAVDLDGFYILPGIIDLHGPTLDRGPARAVASSAGLRRADRQAASHGVTTSWVVQNWSHGPGAAGPELAEATMIRLARYRPQALTDLRIKIRYGWHDVDLARRLCRALRHHALDYVVLDARLADPVSAEGRVPESLARLAETFDACGLHYGSSGDADVAQRDALAMIGARSCEFPAALPPARIARATGHPVVAAASGPIAAEGCDALASDGDQGALAQAAFALVDSGRMSLAAAWPLISERPADIMGLPDRGRIEPRKRADLAIVNSRTRAVEATIRGGRLVHAGGEALHRFEMAGALRLPVAAE